MSTPFRHCDVLVVGAGIVGLSIAVEALRQGSSVTIVDRDSRAVGASVRNFGHACVTAQSGELLELALAARERWLDLSAKAGFFSVESGALAVARTPEELAVLEELSGSREAGQVRLVDAEHVRSTLGSDAEVVGGAVLRDDLRVNPREAVCAIAAWLATQPGVTILWRTSYLGHDGELAHTSRGEISAERTFVCVGHDLDYLEPEIASEHEILRCGLQMALVEAPGARRIAPAILSGTSMLRYPAFTGTAASAELRRRIERDDPELIELDANIMFTQRPDRRLLVGDSHTYDATMPPFLSERWSDILLDRVARVLGAPGLTVVERWQGVYASSAKHPYLVEEVAPSVTAVSVTSGVGMTISLGLAIRVLS